MSRILTYNHHLIDPLAPETELVQIEDIAHALSMLCRANGHFRSFYSVGQHCINCMKEAVARGYSERVQLACLLHDASEAYLSDVTRPVKQELPKYLEIEKPLQDAIWLKYLGNPLSREEYAQVFEIDDVMLYHEFLSLMDTRLWDSEPRIYSAPQFAFMEFADCRELYLHFFSKLATISLEE